MTPVASLIVGLLLLYFGVTGRAEMLWQAITRGGNSSKGKQSK